MQSALEAYEWDKTGNDPANKAINQFQKELQCCGAKDRHDWDSIKKPDTDKGLQIIEKLELSIFITIMVLNLNFSLKNMKTCTHRRVAKLKKRLTSEENVPQEKLGYNQNSMK